LVLNKLHVGYFLYFYSLLSAGPGYRMVGYSYSRV